MKDRRDVKIENYQNKGLPGYEQKGSQHYFCTDDLKG